MDFISRWLGRPFAAAASAATGDNVNDENDAGVDGSVPSEGGLSGSTPRTGQLVDLALEADQTTTSDSNMNVTVKTSDVGGGNLLVNLMGTTSASVHGLHAADVAQPQSTELPRIRSGGR